MARLFFCLLTDVFFVVVMMGCFRGGITSDIRLIIPLWIFNAVRVINLEVGGSRETR